MIATTDVYLRGPEWSYCIDKLVNKFFRTNYALFVIACSIGISYDQRLVISDKEDPKYVPKNVLSQHSSVLDTLYQSCILTTSTELMDEKERLEIAFSDDKLSVSNKLNILTEFANFGIIKIKERIIENDDIGTMENIKEFLFSMVEGLNEDMLSSFMK